MPLLGQLLVGLFSGVTGLFSAWLTAQAAVKVAAITAFLGFAGALVALFNGVVAPLAADWFSTPYGQLLGLAFPPVAGSCLAALSTVWAACGLFGLQRRVTLMAAS